MERCPVCNGATTCPAGRYTEVIPVEDGDITYLPNTQENKDLAWKLEAEGTHRWTHTTGKNLYLLPTRKGDYRLLLVGSAQEGRIRRHYGVEGKWVGQCTYAFWVKE